MTIYLRSNRPAKAAIAAVLALSSTAVLAQEIVAPPVAGTVVAPPPAAAEPAPPSTAAPVMAPASPVVQQTASVEARIADAVAKAEAEKAAAPAPRRVARANPAARQPAAPRLVAPVAAPAANMADAPVPQPTPALTAPISSVETAPAAQPAPAPAQATAASDSDNRGIVLGLGGAALLLAGFAGTALAMRRRRQVRETVVYDEAVPVTPALAAAAPVYTQPVAMPPAAPVMAQPQGAPLTDLDAMIAAPPSPENPFLTHAKRKRRAMALLREREEGVADTLPASSTPVAATAQNQVDRSQTIYSFGKVGGRRKDWVPGIG